MTPPDTQAKVEPASLERREPDRRDILDMLDAISQRMEADVRDAFAAMGLSVGVQPVASRVQNFGAWRDTLPSGCAVAICQLAQQQSQTLLSVPPSIVSRLTDIFFGGEGEVVSASPTLTSIDERIFKRLASTIAAAHGRALLSNDEAEISHIETSRDSLRLAREGDAIIVQSLAISRGKTLLGQIELVHVAARMRGPVPEQAETPVNESTGAAWRKALHTALLTVHLPVRCVLARPEMTLDKLMSLVPGDIIPIIVPDHIPVIVSGTVFASGSIGEANGHAAIRIEQIERR